MDKKNKIDTHSISNELLKLILQYETKRDMSGPLKKSFVIKAIKGTFPKLTEEQIDLISEMIDIIILFHKIHKSTNIFKNCLKCLQ